MAVHMIMIMTIVMIMPFMPMTAAHVGATSTFTTMRMPAPVTRAPAMSMVVARIDVAATPVRTGFVQFRTIRGNTAGVRHWWLPREFCGLVNTLKPLQGQGRVEEGFMKIGELAKIAHCTTETIRFYEKERLLPEAERTEANYRSYTAKHVERLRFIRNCRALDMTHDEIRALLRLTDAPANGCGGMHALIDEHVAHVDTRIEELQQLKAQLTTLRDQCHGEHPVEDCGIVHGLTDMDVAVPRPRHTHLG